MTIGEEVWTMTDDVGMTHRHGEDERPMSHYDDSHVDGLRVRQFACECGFVAAVLSRVEDEAQGGSWPFSFRAPAPLA